MFSLHLRLRISQVEGVLCAHVHICTVRLCVNRSQLMDLTMQMVLVEAVQADA